MGSGWGCGCRTPCQDAAREGSEKAGSRGVLGQGGKQVGPLSGATAGVGTGSPSTSEPSLPPAGSAGWRDRTCRWPCGLACRPASSTRHHHRTELCTQSRTRPVHTCHTCVPACPHTHTSVHTQHPHPELTGNMTPEDRAPSRMAQAEQGAARVSVSSRPEGEDEADNAEGWGETPREQRGSTRGCRRQLRAQRRAISPAAGARSRRTEIAAGRGASRRGNQVAGGGATRAWLPTLPLRTGIPKCEFIPQSVVKTADSPPEHPQETTMAGRRPPRVEGRDSNFIPSKTVTGVNGPPRQTLRGPGSGGFCRRGTSRELDLSHGSPTGSCTLVRLALGCIAKPVAK